MAIPANLQRKPFLAPIGLAAIAAIVAMLVLLVVTWFLVTAKSTTIIVVRHGETAEAGGTPGVDPPLSSDGEARAQTLARMFGDPRIRDHIDAIYVSPTIRSRSTAAPLAARLGLAPTVVAEDDPRALARRILREHRGGRILVVAHSPEIPALVAALSRARDIPPVTKEEYGTMYIVTVPRIGRANLLSVDY
jgi:2,3-bisphosphoglycerate-dependent phosphoglycerate mutase